MEPGHLMDHKCWKTRLRCSCLWLSPSIPSRVPSLFLNWKKKTISRSFHEHSCGLQFKHILIIYSYLVGSENFVFFPLNICKFVIFDFKAINSSFPILPCACSLGWSHLSRCKAWFPGRLPWKHVTLWQVLYCLLSTWLPGRVIWCSSIRKQS